MIGSKSSIEAGPMIRWISVVAPVLILLAGLVAPRADAAGIQRLASFDRANGKLPYAGLTVMNGSLYGTTVEGGANGDGAVFVYTPHKGLRILASFDGGNGKGPYGGLTAMNGSLYGTTVEGGANGDGAVFVYTPGKGLRILAS